MQKHFTHEDFSDYQQLFIFFNNFLNEEHLTLYLQPLFIYSIDTCIHSTNTCAKHYSGC